MKLAEWNDGYIFDADPRREDPLYYYLRDGAWHSAIGIEVEPLYEEHKAARVTIRVWPDHLPREAGLEAIARRDMYPRVISALLSRFRGWSAVTFESPRILEIRGDGLVSAEFKKAGFSCSVSTTDSETWTKPNKLPGLTC